MKKVTLLPHERQIAAVMWQSLMTHPFDHPYVTYSNQTIHPQHHNATLYPYIMKRRVPLVKQELLILPEHLSSPPCYSIFSFICMFCRSLFVLLYFFFWSLSCLFFFDIRILITPLVSPNSSYSCRKTIPLISSKQTTTSGLNSLNTKRVHDI